MGQGFPKLPSELAVIANCCIYNASCCTAWFKSISINSNLTTIPLLVLLFLADSILARYLCTNVRTHIWIYRYVWCMQLWFRCRTLLPSV